MNKSFKRDIQLLTKILDNQNKMIKTLKRFGCNQKNLENDIEAFDLCAFYMAQIGEASKLLTDSTISSFSVFDPLVTKKFRNMIDHVYEDVNRAYLKAFIFSTISQPSIQEIINRLSYCRENANNSDN